MVVFAVDRALEAAWNPSISVNVAPTLTMQNRYLFVADVKGVLEGLEDCKRKFFRKVSDSERLALQGFKKTLAEDLSPSSALKASGNAYPVPLMIAVIHPMLKAFANPDGEFVFAAWPPSSMQQLSMPAKLKDFQKALQRKPRALKRPRQQEEANLCKATSQKMQQLSVYLG